MRIDKLRKLSKSYKDGFIESKVFKYFKGFIATTLHLIIMSLLIVISIFSFNVKVLSVALFFSLFLLIINLAIHNCPLTEIEEEVWGDSSVDFLNRHFPINYNSGRKFEVQLQYIFIVSAIIAIKLMFYFVRDDLKNYMNIKYT